MRTFFIYEGIISFTDYTKLKDRIKVLENLVSPLMNRAGFHFREQKEAALGLHYFNETEEFKGSIALYFENTPHQPIFSLGTTKYFDDEGYRHAAEETILKNADLSIIEPQIISLFQKALDIYNNWEKKDLVKSVKLTPVKMITKEQLEEFSKQAGIQLHNTKDLEEYLKRKNTED